MEIFVELYMRFLRDPQFQVGLRIAVGHASSHANGHHGRPGFDQLHRVPQLAFCRTSGGRVWSSVVGDVPL
eukprot:CAMPEP_0114235486 /NCGR_PEP_ID=MMETSP0058-20121206/6278_1 /TAXON_ID=36894 /ORGANISM="Pyramimonas parkeae, CCMP726" /LENGTH=70 /DNA_ID=CAMNT_0001347255 /DNA_START=201 /DNA_END=409 /DNA_ORIENTATION=+